MQTYYKGIYFEMNKETLREEWNDSDYANWIRSLRMPSGYKQIENIADWWLSKFQDLLKEVEGMKKEYENEEFEDGGDDEYADRRIRIQRLTVGNYNTALDSVIQIINNKIK